MKIKDSLFSAFHTEKEPKKYLMHPNVLGGIQQNRRRG